VEKIVIPAKSNTKSPPTPMPPTTPQVTTAVVPLTAPESQTTQTLVSTAISASTPTPTEKELPETSPISNGDALSPLSPDALSPTAQMINRSPSEIALDSKVKQMARQFDEDGGVANKRSNNFIANAKAKYSFERRKRERNVSNDSDAISYRASVESSDRGALSTSSSVTSQGMMTSPQVMRKSSFSDLAANFPGTSTDSLVDSRNTRVGDTISRAVTPAKDFASREAAKSNGSSQESKVSVLDIVSPASSTADSGFLDSHKPAIPSRSPNRSPNSRIPIKVDSSTSQKAAELDVAELAIGTSKVSPSFKPIDTFTRQVDTPPLTVKIPGGFPVDNTDSNNTVRRRQHSIVSPTVEQLQSAASFVESPVLGNAIMAHTVQISSTMSHDPNISPTSPELSEPANRPLEVIHEETPALNVTKVESPVDRNHSVTPNISHPDDPVYATQPEKSKIASNPESPELLHDGRDSNRSSASSKLAEPTSSYEDLAGISIHNRNNTNGDAGSDTSVEDIEDTKVTTSHITTDIPMTIQSDRRPATPEMSPASMTSPTLKSSPSRVSKIWAEKVGKNIHTQIDEVFSDAEEVTPSPMYKPAVSSPPTTTKMAYVEDSAVAPDSPTPYKRSLRDYDAFRSLTKKMVGTKERVETILTAKLTQENICKLFFGYNNVKILVREELHYARELNIGLTELVLKLWLGSDIDDEALLKAILFGKNNGLSDALVLTLSPLGMYFRDVADGSW
jgi:hypothetical protein